MIEAVRKFRSASCFTILKYVNKKTTPNFSGEIIEIIEINTPRSLDKSPPSINRSLEKIEKSKKANTNHTVGTTNRAVRRFLCSTYTSRSPTSLSTISFV